MIREWCALNILTWKCASRLNGVPFSTSQLPKVVQDRQFFTLLTCTCASRHKGVHFFDISTSKSAPKLKCFEKRASSHNGVHFFSTSQLTKVVREWCALCILTWKCASRLNGVPFSTSQLPKVVQDRQFFTLLTCTCASRHKGVHFFDISTSKSAPKLKCFEKCASSHNGVHFFRHLNLQKWSGNGVLCAF